MQNTGQYVYFSFIDYLPIYILLQLRNPFWFIWFHMFDKNVSLGVTMLLLIFSVNVEMRTNETKQFPTIIL